MRCRWPRSSRCGVFAEVQAGKDGVQANETRWIRSVGAVLGLESAGKLKVPSIASLHYV